MKRIATAFLPVCALTACVAVVPISPPVATGTASSVPVVATDSFTRQINAFRAESGVGPLRQSPTLTQAAKAHADDMQARGYFAHRSPTGGTLMTRARAAGCAMRAGAENIAQGQPTETAVLNGWANSSGHRSNMLNSRMTEYGLGRSGDIWVLKLSSGC